MTAAHAAEALGLAIQPRLEVGVWGPMFPGDPYTLQVQNKSKWPASKIKVAYAMDDGRRGEEFIDFLGPEPSEATFRFPDPLPTEYDDPNWQGQAEIEDRLVTTYSDERDLLRWRMTTLELSEFHRDDEGEGGGHETQTAVERIR